MNKRLTEIVTKSILNMKIFITLLNLFEIPLLFSSNKGRWSPRVVSKAAGFSTATLKFYCHSTATSTASGSRDQKTVLQPLAVEVKNSSTASGSRIKKTFYCHWQ